MDMDAVERLIGLFARYNLTELDYAEGGTKLRIAREGRGLAAERSVDAPAPPPPEPTDGTEPKEHLLCAGIAGTFFRAPAPGQAPFVSEGDRIEEGQTLGILEAMKMLNPVEADGAGRILRIMVGDGTSVLAGTPLFAIARAD